MIGRGADVTIIEPDQQLPGVDPLIVGDQDFGDEAGNVRRDRRDVAADIGVVGTLEEAVDGPPIVAVSGRR